MLLSTRAARLLVAGLLMALPSAVSRAAEDSAEPKSRTFEFTYQVTVTGLPPGKTARIWLPVPPSNDDQKVETVGSNLPGKPEFHREPRFGNKIAYVEAEANGEGNVPLSLTYRVTRHEVKTNLKKHADDNARL